MQVAVYRTYLTIGHIDESTSDGKTVADAIRQDQDTDETSKHAQELYQEYIDCTPHAEDSVIDAQEIEGELDIAPLENETKELVE